MKKLDISLGQNLQEPSPMSAAMSPETYPTFHYEGPDALPIPDHGQMVIHYQLKRAVEERNPPAGEAGDRYRCDIEVVKILGAEPAREDVPPSRRDTSTEDALDSLMKEREEDDEDDEGGEED